FDSLNNPLYPNYIYGDFNGDGKTDIIYGGHLYLSTGRGFIQTSAVLPTGLTPQTAEVGDFNGDGKTDIAYDTLSSTTVFLSTGTDFVQVAVLPNVAVFSTVGTADFNNDGATD